MSSQSVQACGILKQQLCVDRLLPFGWVAVHFSQQPSASLAVS
jgi:hypothetical protein